MHARRAVAIAVPVFVLLSCTRSTAPPVRSHRTQASPSDVLVLGTEAGVSALDARSGRATSLIAGAVPEPDWSHVYTATSNAGATTITRIETATGDPVSSTTVRGDLQIRAVAPSGLGVALMPQGTSGRDAWLPRSRARTHIVVADPSGVTAPQRFDLKGNFEPEAFSPDGERLYMLQYRPALDPTSYRVIGLYLETGKRWALIGPNKQPVENMTATRLVQVPSPDGSYLYTLYTNQRPTYLGSRPPRPIRRRRRRRRSSTRWT